MKRLLATLLFSVSVPELQAHDGIRHTPASATPAPYDWALDIMLSYRDQPAAVARGFLPVNGHRESAGLNLQHVDISRDFRWNDRWNNQQTARVTLSSHDDGAEIDEAWATQTYGNWSLRFGQQRLDLGLRNALHEHNWTMISPTLVNQVFWGGQTAEAGINLQHDAQQGHWWFRQQLGGFSTTLFDTNAASAAALASSVLGYRSETRLMGIKLDLYHASLQDRGLTLFALNPQQHSHGNTATEFFAGHLTQFGLSLFMHQSITAGTLTFETEYQQRQERGALSSAAGQTTDATANLQLDSWGGYAEAGFKANNGLMAALRHEWLGSDVDLSEVASSDLASSVLNQAGDDPQRQIMLLGYRFNDQGNTTVKYQWQQQNSWLRGSAQWQLLAQQSYRF
ncbi:MAG: hypothetical protein LRY66_06920 [Saccharospirillaceae bacterium]|nr:hypothetical protein [Saccharospirillaceae bacterium]MCD8531084.1 hypothetical protein [Saccharospirillaceae bacterium]